MIVNTEDITEQPLQVALAGFGRSGSQSLAVALERLGYNSCHGSTIVPNLVGSHEALAKAIMEHDIEKILQETAKLGYNATLECHSPFWKDLMQKRPHAKYIFMIRPFDSWHSSLVSLYQSLSPLYRYPLRFVIPFASRLLEFSSRLSAHSFGYPEDVEVGRRLVLEPSSEDSRQIYKEAHEAFVREALRVTKTHDNALLFNIRTDGYSELCTFLEIPTPQCPRNEPFPHMNSSSALKVTWLVFILVEGFLYCAAILLVTKLLVLPIFRPRKKIKEQ